MYKKTRKTQHRARTAPKLPPDRSKSSQNLPNPSPTPPKTLPKPCPNPWKIAILSKKLILRFWAPLWTEKWSPKARQDPPKWRQNRRKIDEKSMLKMYRFFNAFLHRFFSIFDLKIHAFWDAFLMHFRSKCQKRKTLKISIFPKENHHFWRVGHRKKH